MFFPLEVNCKASLNNQSRLDLFLIYIGATQRALQCFNQVEKDKIIKKP